MRVRTIPILVAVLVVLAAAAMLFESSRRRATTASGESLFPDMKVEQLDRIRFREGSEGRAGRETILEKRQDRWLVASEGGHPADTNLVSAILERLPSISADQVASTNPERRSIFQVDSTGTEVWLGQGSKEVGHFFVGKPGPDWLSTYVRRADSPEVLLVPVELPSLFHGHDTWRDKTVFALDAGAINRYEYSSPSRGHVVAVRDSTGWRLEQPAGGESGLDASRLDMVVRSFATLKAAGFADTSNAVTAGTAADTTWIAATLADGSTQRLRIGLPAAMRRAHVQKEGSESIVLVPQGALNTMMPPADVMRQSAAAVGR